MSDTGWVALAGQWVTVDGTTETIYSWDERYWPNRSAAIAAGAELANGTDDFNLAHVENGNVTWWGWMNEAHPIDDAHDAAMQYGWSVRKDGAS